MTSIDPDLQRRFGMLTSEQVAALDSAAVAVGVDVLQLMEMAGLQVARCAWDMLDQRPGAVTVVAGKGNNGGDGLVAARMLATWGCQITVHLITPETGLAPMLRRHVASARACGADIRVFDGDSASGFTGATLLIDAVLGTGLRADPRRSHLAALRAMNESGVTVLSVDVPSGLDATTGHPFTGCVQATRTCTLTAMKAGLWAPPAAQFAGAIQVADIAMPSAAWHAAGLIPPSDVVAGKLLPVPSAT